MTETVETEVYKEYKLLLGFVGLSLPMVLYFGWILDLGILFTDTQYKGSISAYYYTNMKYFFVGYMFAMALVLIFYRGNSRGENIFGILAGICAILVALYPTKSDIETDLNTRAIIHYVSSALLYIFLSLFALYYFPEKELNDDSLKAKRIKKRNKAYKLLGWLTLLFLFSIIAVVFLAHQNIIDPPHGWTLLLETFTNTSFGLAWAINGRGFWRFNNDNKFNTKLEFSGAVLNTIFITLSILMVVHIGWFTFF